MTASIDSSSSSSLAEDIRPSHSAKTRFHGAEMPRTERKGNLLYEADMALNNQVLGMLGCARDALPQNVLIRVASLEVEPQHVSLHFMASCSPLWKVAGPN